ncbi:MAG: response regulator [Myxococcales bacterium]
MDNEEHQRTHRERRQTALTLLAAGTVLVTLALLVSFMLRPESLTPHVPYLGTLVSHVVALLLIAKSRLRAGICFFTASYLGVIGGEIARSGVCAPLAYVALPIVSFVGLTWSGRAAAVVATASSAMLLAGALLQNAESLPAPTPQAPLLVWLTATVCLLITATMIWVGLGILNRSRAEAAAHERARRHLEQRLGEAQRLDSVGRLAAGVAHDFNNLLTVVFSEASRLAATHAGARAGAENILSAAERAAALTRKLLTFGRRREGQASTFDLNETIRELHNLLGKFLGEGVQFNLELGPEPLWVRADRVEIEQILLNLVTNARDAMPRGGSLTVRTGRATRIQLEHAIPLWRGSSDAVALSVIDTGLGMDRDVMRHLFEPFFTTKELGKGSGLGLSTVRHIVSSLHGSMLVDSAPGYGSTFTVLLPLTQESATGHPLESVPPDRTYEVRGARILVVDDDDQVRESVATALRSAGYVVEVARSGEEGLTLVERSSQGFDLLVTDVVMAGMHGPELASRVRRLRPEQSVLFMSGYEEERLSDERRAIEQAEFISKPFRTPQLLTSVRGLLRARRQRGSSHSQGN